MFLTEPQDKLSRIAESIIRLSDYYIAQPDGGTPWNEKFCQLAYIHYYLPLNQVRVSHVLKRGLEVNFFNGLTSFVDWGCGPGTASLAIAENAELTAQITEQLLYDISATALKNFRNLHKSLKNPQYTNDYDLNRHKNHKNSCLVLSYSLTEFQKLPSGWNLFEAIMILEPSTSQDGRRLMTLRQELQHAGFTIWAPCTHQLNCPLLTHSKADWCHDRVKVEAPEWFDDLQQLLPMKNNTITTSYILARKTKPSENLQTKARLTGDSLPENGKTRQLICRGENREFLTWMHKMISPQTIPRGDLIDLNFEFEVKSNELRLTKPIETKI